MLKFCKMYLKTFEKTLKKENVQFTYSSVDVTISIEKIQNINITEIILYEQI